MEKRIELEKRGRSHDQIKELNLDNCRSTTIVGLDDSFVNLECLSMINIGLTTLKGFPKLPALRRLELSDNRISSGLNHLKESINLEYLNLCGNKIKEIETLEPLRELKNLEILDLFNCDVTEVPDYRKKVFEMLPNLSYLDGYDRNDKEIEDEDDDGEENDEENENDDVDDEEGDDDLLDDVDDDDEDIDDDEEEEGEELGLSYLARDKIDEEDENDEFEPNGADEEDDDDEEIDEEDDELNASGDVAYAKGMKRKVAEEVEDDDEDGEDNSLDHQVQKKKH